VYYKTNKAFIRELYAFVLYPLRDIAGKKIEKNKNLTIEAPNDAMWVKPIAITEYPI